MKGIYCLVAYLGKNMEIGIAGLGRLKFRRGYYCYIGSAMTSLEKRIERHYAKKKKRHWHIDYFLEHAKLVGFKALEMTNREECWLAEQVRRISDGEVKGFGSSDCGCGSHLQYFRENPLMLRRFTRIFRPRLEELLKSYAEKKIAIKKRVLEFREAWKWPDEDIFAELCFCICTPQSSARKCHNAVVRMERRGMLMKGDEEGISRNLTGVRFPRNKARYIVCARNFFARGGELDVKGASHFLRNIGLGERLAILDRHILKNLLRYGIITEVPKNLTPKRYLEIEKRMKRFAKRVDIPLAELDLLFWSEETGEIFK
jgi:N-glycosylase/DNA lyase